MSIRYPAVALLSLSLMLQAKEKLTDEQRIEILRGLTAEYATIKEFLPRSKKPLPFPADGSYDKKAWQEAGREFGPAGRVGDLVQITKVSIDDDKILLEINNGMKSGRKWYERIEVGMGGSTRPIGRNDSTAPGGTNIALVFGKAAIPGTAAEIKKLLAPILDFEKRSATENYIETLPAPIQEAIKEKKAVEGMDREQVILAMGRPRHKSRETRDGDDLEDWVYGQPPGRITFVTFHNGKVIQVKESYAGLGGATAEPIKPPL